MPGRPGGHSLDLELLGPRFDLPLENIRWQVFLSDKWEVKDWTGSLQLEEQKSVTAPVAVDVQTAYENTPGYAAQQSTLGLMRIFTLLIGLLVIGGFFQIRVLQKVRATSFFC